MFKKDLPLRLYAVLLLALAGGVFYASYGLSNALTELRPHVGEVFFEWETAIPFVVWTILPYWSLNLFYALAFLLCNSREELHGYIKQLLLAQAIAITGFLLFPLHFSWPKPETEGLFGALFSSLVIFDEPYNQSPSLHIILSVVVGWFYWQKLSASRWKSLRGLWLLWLLLIAVSVLTTYQHHFIDIPTGLMVGLLIVWAFPVAKPSLFSYRHQTTTRHKRWAAFYLGLALVFVLLAWGLAALSPAWLWLLYPAFSCLLVALAYAFFGVAVFDKQATGKLGFAATLLLLPYLLAVRLNIGYWLRGKAKFHPVNCPLSSAVNVGSITAAGHFDCVVDVCGEYPCLAKIKHYQCLPLLDMVAPTPSLLRQAAELIEQQRQDNNDILVCCALGYGRSVAVVLTWLVRYGGCANLAQAIEVMKTAHPQMVLADKTRIAIDNAIAQ